MGEEKGREGKKGKNEKDFVLAFTSQEFFSLLTFAYTDLH